MAQTEICEERNSAGSTVTKRFFGQGVESSSTDYFYTTDHLGSIREMTDGSGTIQSRYDYDPYGRQTKLSGMRSQRTNIVAFQIPKRQTNA